MQLSLEVIIINYNNAVLARRGKHYAGVMYTEQ